MGWLVRSSRCGVGAVVGLVLVTRNRQEDAWYGGMAEDDASFLVYESVGNVGSKKATPTNVVLVDLSQGAARAGTQISWSK